MKKSRTRTKIYAKVTPGNHEIIYSGIEFTEFIKFLLPPIENLILIKGDYWGNKHNHNFELLEGQEQVEKLSKEDIYNFGDFCFVDYLKAGDTAGLSDQQIAELLFIAHIGRPLDSPFFAPLQNRFAYLAHDDGWFCKLFCRNLDDFINVLCGKIAADTVLPVPNSIQDQLLQLATQGILIDLEEMNHKKGWSDLKIYIIGEYTDMDYILNHFQNLKATAIKISTLSRFGKQWYLE